MSEPRGNLTKNLNVRLGPDLHALLAEVKATTGRGMNSLMLEGAIMFVMEWYKADGRPIPVHIVEGLLRESFGRITVLLEDLI